MKFEFYVINYNFNKQKTEMFNIFDNINVQEYSEQAVKKYLRSPKKFSKYDYQTQTTIYGWKAFVKEIDSIIAWQERGRCEYEISANEKFVIEILDICNEIDKFDSLEAFKEYLKKKNQRYHQSNTWDCWDQAHANIEIICHDIIRQYKEKK